MGRKGGKRKKANPEWMGGGKQDTLEGIVGKQTEKQRGEREDNKQSLSRKNEGRQTRYS